MTDKNPSYEDNSSLSSILHKREAAASSIPRDTSRPTSASSTSSFQLVPSEMESSTPLKSNMVSGIRGESLSGGGFTGEKSANLMSILTDSKVASSKKLPSSSTPRGLAYQLYFVTPLMIRSNDICGGQITSKYDAFCAKSVEACKTKSHLEKKHKMCASNTIFIIGRSNTVGSSSSDKIINPSQYHLEVAVEHSSLARDLMQNSNAKLFGVKNFDKAARMFNSFVDEFNFALENERNIKEELVPSEVKVLAIKEPDANDNKFASGTIMTPSGYDSDSSESSGSSSSNESGLSFDNSFQPSKRSGNEGLGKDIKYPKMLGLNEVDQEHVAIGVKFGEGFKEDPIAYIGMLGAHMAKQESIILGLTEELKRVKTNAISSTQLHMALNPIRTDIRGNQECFDKTKLSLEKLRKKQSETRLRSSTR